MAGKTGPTSLSGNAIKHGLRSNRWMSSKEQKGFDALAADLDQEYKPSTATQRILIERIALSTTNLRRLHLIEDARFHNARVDDLNDRLEFYPNSPTLKLEQTEVGALPPLPLLETLSRYQTALDRQLSKAIGEFMTLKANELTLLTTSSAAFSPN